MFCWHFGWSKGKTFEDTANEAHTDLEEYQIPWTCKAQTVPMLKEIRLLLWCILLILGQNHCWQCCGNILEKQSMISGMDHFHTSRSLLSAKAASQVCTHDITDVGLFTCSGWSGQGVSTAELVVTKLASLQRVLHPYKMGGSFKVSKINNT